MALSERLRGQLTRARQLPRLRERAQSRGEELANSVSHGVGLVVAVAAAVFLIVRTVRTGSPMRIVACSVYASTLVLMYMSSTLYHAMPRGRTKYVLRICDHGAIFLLIAGTYTPFTLGVLRGPLGWTLLAIVWSIAIAGVVLTAISRVRYPTLLTVLYLSMGWMILVGIQQLWESMGPRGVLWLGVGGLFYTVGVAFFAADRLRYGHLVWHLFVIAGTLCHYIDVMFYSG